MKYELMQSAAGLLKVWDEPKLTARYSIGCDPSTGKVRDRKRSAQAQLYSYSDDRPDYTSIIVVEIETGKHVASWHGYILPTDLYRKLAAIGYYYNTALLVVENNPPSGPTVVQGLTMILEYPNIYRSKVFNKPDRDLLGGDWGWNTTGQTRPHLIARIHELLGSDSLFTRDKDLVRELQTMQIDETGVERAKGKHKDDRVFALGMALQGRWEALYGTLLPDDERDLVNLPEMDRAVWKHLRRKMRQQEHEHGRGDGGPLGSLRRLPGLGRLRHR